jgi:hypothetical protein
MICIEKTIKFHVFQSPSANKKVCFLFLIAKSGPTQKARQLDEKCPMDQWGNKRLMQAAACSAHQILRKFGETPKIRRSPLGYKAPFS